MWWMVLSLAFAEPSDESILAIQDRAFAHFEAREFAQAEAALREIVDIAIRSGEDSDAEILDVRDDLAAMVEHQADYTRALELHRETLAIRRRTLSLGHADISRNLTIIGGLLHKQGLYDDAVPVFEEAIAIASGLETSEPLLSQAQGSLATLYQRMGDYPASLRLYEEVLERQWEAVGPRDASVGKTLNNMALVHNLLGDASEAQRLLEESLKISRAIHPVHVDVATSLGNLAEAHLNQGNYLEARRLYEEGLRMRRELLDPGHPGIAESLNNLAGVAQDQGDYAGARGLYEGCLDILVPAFGARHPDVAMAQNNLAGLLVDQGDYAAARPLYEASLDVAREVFGPKHANVAMLLNNMALMDLEQGDYDAALPLLEESLAMAVEVYGPRHPRVATSLGSLANLHRVRGDFETALQLFDQSLEITREQLGPRHPRIATTLGNKAVLLSNQEDFAGSRVLSEEVLGIQRQSLGPHHPKVAHRLTLLAELLRSQEDIEGARPLHAEALGIMEERLARLEGLSEREALRFLPKARLSLDSWLAGWYRPEDAEEAWQHILRFKGVVAARTRSTRLLASVEPELAPIAADLDAVKRQVAQLTFGEVPANERVEHGKRVVALVAEQDRLERDLISRSDRFRGASAEITPSALCDALPHRAVLVDFFRYGRAGELRYLAFVLRKSDCELRRVELGRAGILEAAVDSWHTVLRQGDAAPGRVRTRGRTLSALLLDPIAAVAGDSEHWLVVPDGALGVIPFGALPTESGFAIEDRLITYLDRANDMLLEHSVVGAGALAVGDVDYDADREESDAPRAFLAPCNGGDFVRLPGTSVEVEGLSSRWARSRRREPMLTLEGPGATESAVGAALEGKALAHIATHGFFATGDCKSAVDDGVGFDPMLLSGLVLAGANQPPDPLAPEDGILTASEVATLDLSAAKLVVLSACETGLGEIESGQGVLGLRRAFAIAGARTLVMSLWSIPDTETAVLMDGLYRRHLKRRPMSAAEALRQAQLEMLAAQRSAGEEHPFAWAAFISSGDWR